MVTPEERRFEILGLLGQGGFGKVYLAQLQGEGGFSRKVALKVHLPADDQPGMEEELARRLRDEGRVMGLVQHPAIVQVLGLVRLANRWAVVMEYVEGVDLRVLRKAGVQVPLGPTLEIVEEVAEALAAAWCQPGPEGRPLQLIHRDIKPGNLQLTVHGRIKVLDFGIARADFDRRESKTVDLHFLTEGYAAPERYLRVECHEGDVYSLGVVFAELLLGSKLPEMGLSNREQVRGMDALLNDLAPRLPGPIVEDLLWLLSSMLAYTPQARPSATEVAARCRALRARLPNEPLLRMWALDVVAGLVGLPPQTQQDPWVGQCVSEQRFTGQNDPVVSAKEEPPQETFPAAPRRASRRIILPLLVVGALAVAVATVALWGSEELDPHPPQVPSQPTDPVGTLSSLLAGTTPLPEGGPEVQPPSSADVPPSGSTVKPSSTGGQPVAPHTNTRRPGAAAAPAHDDPPPTATRELGDEHGESTIAKPMELSSSFPDSQEAIEPPAGGDGAPDSDQAPTAAPAAGVYVSVNWEGEGTLHLTRGDERHRVPGTVLPGQYQMEATFNRSRDTTSTMKVGDVDISAGQPITISCRASFTRCQVDR